MIIHLFSSQVTWLFGQAGSGPAKQNSALLATCLGFRIQSCPPNQLPEAFLNCNQIVINSSCIGLCRDLKSSSKDIIWIPTLYVVSHAWTILTLNCWFSDTFNMLSLPYVIRSNRVEWDQTEVLYFIFSCIDINECSTGAHDCDTPERGQCINTRGGFACSCKDPFVGDGRACTLVSVINSLSQVFVLLVHNRKSTSAMLTCLCYCIPDEAQ